MDADLRPVRVVFWVWLTVIAAGLTAMILLPLAGR